MSKMPCSGDPCLHCGPAQHALIWNNDKIGGQNLRFLHPKENSGAAEPICNISYEFKRYVSPHLHNKEA